MVHHQNSAAATTSSTLPHARKRNNNRNDQRSSPRKRPRRGPPPPPPKPVCSVCADPEKKPSYKCPKCLALYCTVTCCKQHKEICKGKPPQEETSKKKGGPLLLSALPVLRRSGFENAHDDDDESLEEGWKITDSMKSALKHSEWLREELKDNGGLRELISQIVVSKNTQALLQVHERYPSFRPFLDKLLVVADVLERQDDEHDEPLKDWLERHWTEEDSPPILTLKPIPRSLPVFEPVHASSSSSSSNESESEEESSSATGSSSSEDEDSEDPSGEEK